MLRSLVMHIEQVATSPSEKKSLMGDLTSIKAAYYNLWGNRCSRIKFDEDAIAMAKNTEYGLSSAVFTQYLQKKFATAYQLESGQASY
ncbi:hypothetical protein BELL_0039g00050 [Botrytis elliptica]|uniref:Aldehyde dehydrogenase domain-containing protein n=1 Tax=Botrytis elliptica TaxID=278938 RepID=A0A4Z1JZ55_9HELO|nr:hypothetical protein BELL_0039g00050 [Botrytis elliptica]